MKRPSPSAVAVYALTRQGIVQALRIAEATGAHVFVPETAGPVPPRAEAAAGGPAGITASRFRSLKEQVAAIFHAYSKHIFITAAGIAVRCIAPLTASKFDDPAVLVVDQRARFVISLLSGHAGGGNAFAREIAELLGAVPVITTATDTEGLPALDVLAAERGLSIADAEAVKSVSAALLAGTPVGLHDPCRRLELSGTPEAARFFPLIDCAPQEGPPAVLETSARAPCVVVSEYALRLPPGALLLHPRTLFVGIGCKRGATAAAVLDMLRALAAEAGLAPASLAGLASFAAKRDEPALHEAAEALDLPLLFFSWNTLAALPVTRISIKAKEAFGLNGVCEPAALAAAMGCEQGFEPPPYAARLVLPKQVRAGMTAAVAQRTS